VSLAEAARILLAPNVPECRLYVNNEDRAEVPRQKRRLLGCRVSEASTCKSRGH